MKKANYGGECDSRPSAGSAKSSSNKSQRGSAKSANYGGESDSRPSAGSAKKGNR